MLLVLFDIDGTLLSGASRAHAQALMEAVAEVYGIRDPAAAGVHAAGRTDLEIARQIALTRDVSAERFDSRLEDLRAACCARYEGLCPPSLADCVVPGMAELLARLAGRGDMRLSLVTGNLEPVARLKLRRAGLGAFFPRGQGGFGSDSEDRTDLPALARRRAGQGGSPHPRARTVVVGDTPRDIACAHADGVRCVAVTTGPYAADQLGAADVVARSIGELESALDVAAG